MHCSLFVTSEFEIRVIPVSLRSEDSRVRERAIRKTKDLSIKLFRRQGRQVTSKRYKERQFLIVKNLLS